MLLLLLVWLLNLWSRLFRLHRRHRHFLSILHFAICTTCSRWSDGWSLCLSPVVLCRIVGEARSRTSFLGKRLNSNALGSSQSLWRRPVRSPRGFLSRLFPIASSLFLFADLCRSTHTYTHSQIFFLLVQCAAGTAAVSSDPPALQVVQLTFPNPPHLMLPSDISCFASSSSVKPSPFIFPVVRESQGTRWP